MSPTLHFSALQILAVKSPDINSPLASLANVDDEAPIARRRSFFVMSLSISSFQSFLYDTLTLASLLLTAYIIPKNGRFEQTPNSVFRTFRFYYTQNGFRFLLSTLYNAITKRESVSPCALFKTPARGLLVVAALRHQTADSAFAGAELPPRAPLWPCADGRNSQPFRG